MTCERSEQLLALHEDGGLSPGEARRVAAHLEGCGRCRALQRELVRSRRWIESAPAPPLAEADFAAVRGGVWREVEARGIDSRRGASASRPLAFVAAGVAAAALGLMWFARREPEPALRRLVPPTAAPPAAALPGPASAIASGRPAPPAAGPFTASRVPAGPVARAARHRVSPGGEPGFARIEFRTANPNVRVIWLVGKGREESAPPAGRNQEVS